MHIGGMVSNNPCMHLLISRSPCPILTIGMISDFGYESGTLLPIVRRNSSLLAYHGSPIKLECFNVSSSNMVYIALWIFPDYRRIPWELTTPSNRGGVTQNSIVDGVMGKFAILRVGFSYPFLPTLSSYPYRNNLFGRPRRRGRLWHVTATVIGSVSVQELNGRPLTEYRNGHNQADCR
ncbi:hypothetical protein J6590_086850 [Homalodisca vitripennis]|nr:hypothetical protein J6590_086850 [Homalodisca vitripennis]